MMYYVALKQFDYSVPGKTAFNSIVKAINFINNKGQVGRSYKINDENHHEFDHVVVEKTRVKQVYNGLEKSNNGRQVCSHTLYGLDTRTNNIHDPFRIDPSSIGHY